MYNLFQNFFGKMVKTLKMSKRGQIYMEDPVVDVFVDSLQSVVLFWPFFGPPNNPFKKRSPVH